VPRYSEATLASIKNAVDIVALVGEYLTLHRTGSKFKALCPFHDDHNPSLELNPERQSFKCWSCGAGGDVFDFVKAYERVEFAEALRMLAERAGIVLETPASGAAPRGPSKSDLYAVNAWAEHEFAEALGRAADPRAYLAERGITPASRDRFRLGYAPDARDWMTSRARKHGYTVELLERAGLATRGSEPSGPVRDRFRGRLIFPIHDDRGRTIGFGGRILPPLLQQMAATGKNVAKYVNSPETPVFQKRRVLYASDLARPAARTAGWVAVVEGYTDVIAAHQSGLANVVGTLGTALGDDHVLALRRLADRIVLIFDGDQAGQKAADRSLELFLAHDVDVRVLSLPETLDPCDFLVREGGDAFRAMIDRAVDPLDFVIQRAEQRFDFDSIEEARQAAEWVLGIFARTPRLSRTGITVKVGQALNKLSARLRLEVKDHTLASRLQQLLRQEKAARNRLRPAAGDRMDSKDRPEVARTSIALKDLDPTDRELLQIVLNEPSIVGRLISRVAVASIRDAPLRTILQACYDVYGEGQSPSFERIVLRLDDPETRALAAGLLLPIEVGPLQADTSPPAPWQDRLRGTLAALAERERQDRLRDLKGALDETNETDSPEAYRALIIEYRRLLNQRPGTKTQNAS
jgi:DNA primase